MARCRNADHMVFGRPVIILLKELSSEHKGGGKEIRTKSSNNSGSPLKWFTNPCRPNVPVFANATRGLNFDDNAVSRKVMRGYDTGIPVLT